MSLGACLQSRHSQDMSPAQDPVQKRKDGLRKYVHDSVTSFGEWNDDMAELIRCLGEAVDEQYRVLGLAGGWETFDIINADLGVGLLKPDLPVAGGWCSVGCH